MLATHSVTPLTATSDTSVPASLKTLLQSSKFADVLLLVGEQRTPVLAHANLISLHCEFYERALEERWNTSQDPVVVPVGVQVDAKTASSLRAVFNHPDVDLKTLTAVLEFVYTGSVQVPDSILTRVAMFADQLLLYSLKDQCLQHLLNHSLTKQNALEFYVISKRLGFLAGTKEALCETFEHFDEAVEAGRGLLADMSEGDVREILACKSLSTIEHWSFLVAWLKSRQDVENLSAGSGIGSLDLSLARDDAVRVLPIFCGSIYSLPPEDFKLFVEPHLSLFSEEMQTCLEFHFNSASKEVQKWEMSPRLSKSNILSRTAMKDLKAALKTAVALPVNRSKMKLLFRGSTAEFDTSKFHEACDGKTNTVTVIKTVSGKVVGGYVDASWSSIRGWIPVKEACLFSYVETGGEKWNTTAIKQECLGLGAFGRQSYGPAFGGGHDLHVVGSRVWCYQSSTYGVAMVEFLGEAACQIEEYEVFQFI
ncbi:hypothetical protein HDU98_006361 [Podochytrium sp. JEL0797]|nr:hypothetical protein HDU98_006361 [Podochytrium sp. JEL0797]